MSNFHYTSDDFFYIEQRESITGYEHFNSNWLSKKYQYEQMNKIFLDATAIKNLADNLQLSLKDKESKPKTESKAMTREDLAREVVDLLGPNEMVYGTYVRDQIAKQSTFREMNVFLTVPTSSRETEIRNKFLAKLQERFGSYSSTSIGSVTTVVDGGTNCQKQKIKIYPNGDARGATIELEVVTNQFNDAFVHAIADVEAVGIKNGQLVAGAGQSLAKIKENIANKVFEPIPGRDSMLKTNKLLEQGYLPKSEKEARKKIEDKKSDEKNHQEAVKKEEVATMNTAPKDGYAVEQPMTFMETMTQDGKEAAYRVAANQMVRAVKMACIQALKNKKAKKSQIQAMSDLLDSEAGSVIISMALGYALKFVPGIKEDPRAQKLSEEFRVNGMATAGNFLVDEVLSVVGPILMDSFKALPATEQKMRVVATTTPDTVVAALEATKDEEEIEVPTVVKATL